MVKSQGNWKKEESIGMLKIGRPEKETFEKSPPLLVSGVGGLEVLV
jgi:hypothetical protein